MLVKMDAANAGGGVGQIPSGQFTTTYPEEYEIDTGLSEIKRFIITAGGNSTVTGATYIDCDFSGTPASNPPTNYINTGGTWAYSTYYAQANGRSDVGGSVSYGMAIKSINGGKITVQAPNGSTCTCIWAASDV